MYSAVVSREMRWRLQLSTRLRAELASAVDAGIHEAGNVCPDPWEPQYGTLCYYWVISRIP